MKSNKLAGVNPVTQDTIQFLCFTGFFSFSLQKFFSLTCPSKKQKIIFQTNASVMISVIFSCFSDSSYTEALGCGCLSHQLQLLSALLRTLHYYNDPFWVLMDFQQIGLFVPVSAPQEWRGGLIDRRDSSLLPTYGFFISVSVGFHDSSLSHPAA